jgi:hypothetical protein
VRDAVGLNDIVRPAPSTATQLKVEMQATAVTPVS